MFYTETFENMKLIPSNWATSDKIALVALVTSILSIVLSLLALRVQKVLNTTNLQAIYYEEIFKNYLMKEIPEKAKKLSYDENGRLCKNYREVNMTLLKMLNDAIYFAYADNAFYEELRKRCEKLDEMLVTEGGKRVPDKDMQKKNIYMINVEIMNLVKYINKRYSYCK